MKTAVITGAGTGVGRATAVMMAQQGWKAALVGRREATLQETAKLAGSEHCLICPCDVGDADAVSAMAAKVLEAFGRVDALVCSAGTNVPDRSLAKLSLANYRHIIDANLHGPYYCAQAFLPKMREQKSGTIINVVSDAGKWGNNISGPAYVISKFGQNGLSQTINAEERHHGIRACAVFPGPIATPLLDKRPEPPPPEARAKMLQAEDVAECILLCANLPARAIVEELLLRPADL